MNKITIFGERNENEIKIIKNLKKKNNFNYQQL